MTDRPDPLHDQAPGEMHGETRDDAPSHLIERAAARMRALVDAGADRPAPPRATGGLALGPFPGPGVAQRVEQPAAAVPAAPPAPPDAAEEAVAGPSQAAEQAAVQDPAKEATQEPAHEREPALALALPAAGPGRSAPGLPAEQALDLAPPELPLPVLERAGLVVGRSIRTRVSEEFRIAVGRIAWTAEQVGPDGVRNPLTLVTSARPGEGKSFTALNLAAVLAQNGPRPVVLVDTDFKQQGMSDLLGLRGRRGLYDLLDSDTPDPRTLLVTTGVPRLSVLPTGRLMEDELGASYTRPLGPRIVALAEAFRDYLVVLDAPPCLATSDPSTLAGMAGQVLLVVEAGRTQRAEVEAALDFVRACPVVSALLNKVRQSNRQTFGYYDYMGNYQ